MKPFYLTVIGLLMSAILFSQTAVKKVTSNIAIDGQLEESFWDISNTISIGSSNNTANFGVLWDDDYLYIGVNVTDGTLCNNKRQGFYDDGIEICIDGNSSQGTSFDNSDRIFVKPIRSYWIQEMEQRFDGVIHNWMETGSGYTMEFAIPWTNFGTAPSAGINIGFNIVVNDDDNCSVVHNIPTQLIWSGSASYYKSPSIWGTLSLSSETVSFSADYLALLNPNGGDFYINNKTTNINWLSNGITNVDIDYSTNNGSNWNSIATNLSANSSSYTWNVSATPSEQCLIRISETGNSSLNDISESIFTISAPLTAVGPLIPNIWKNYQWPYNAYFPEDAGGINGHVGNACGHTSLARILHYWEFPITGNDALDFVDNAGHHWAANFGGTTYNYDNMPYNLTGNSTEDEYTDVATLTYHAATSMHDVGGSGGNLAKMSYAMSHYFNYKVSTPKIRTDYTKAEWIVLLMNELDNGRVLLVDGMTSEFLGVWHENNWTSGHWFHVDGYNEAGQFHGVLGFSNEDGYYDIENLFGYFLNNGVLIGLEPNLKGKELSLQTHIGGENIQAGKISQIRWTSTGVSNIKIEYTVDNGQNWLEIVSSFSASTGSYDWTVPNINSNECKIKLTDVSDINVYDKSNSVFEIFNQLELIVLAPNGGETFQSISQIPIIWEMNGVTEIDLYYSIDGGQNWVPIVSDHSATTIPYLWDVPMATSSNCKIKIEATDISSESLEPFVIVNTEVPGGPFAANENTVLLTSFDNNLDNKSVFSSNAISNGSYDFSLNTVSGMGYCLSLDGNSYLSVPHNEKLNLSGDWTIEAWIKVSSYNSNHQYIINKPGNTDNYLANYAFELQPWWDNVLHAFFFSDEETRINVTDMTPGLNQWYHVAYSRDATDSEISIRVHDHNWNELSSNSRTFSGTDILFSSKDLRIGEGFIGFLDELRITAGSNTPNDIRQDISLNTGWNILSLNVEPENADLLKIVQPLIDNETLHKIIDEGGNITQHMPWGWVNNIGDMSNTEGYYAKVSSNVTLSVYGSVVPCPFDIELFTGWNIMGYPCQNPQDAMEALQVLIDEGKLDKVIDEGGNIMQNMPWGWVNNIGNLSPGEGYYIKLSDNGSITFEEPGDPAPAIRNDIIIETSQTKFFKKSFHGNPFMPMTIVLSDADIIGYDPEIGIYDGDICVGSAIIENDIVLVTAAADDPFTPEIDGFITGNKIIIKVFDRILGSAYILEPEHIQGKNRFSPLETYIGSLKSYSTNPQKFQLENNYLGLIYPNPAHDFTIVEYGLFETSSVIISIYDQLGKRVRIEERPVQLPGVYKYQIDWKNLKTGIYYYRLETTGDSGYFTESKKILLKK